MITVPLICLLLLKHKYDWETSSPYPCTIINLISLIYLIDSIWFHHPFDSTTKATLTHVHMLPTWNVQSNRRAPAKYSFSHTGHPEPSSLHQWNISQPVPFCCGQLLSSPEGRSAHERDGGSHQSPLTILSGYCKTGKRVTSHLRRMMVLTSTSHYCSSSQSWLVHASSKMYPRRCRHLPNDI